MAFVSTTISTTPSHSEYGLTSTGKKRGGKMKRGRRLKLKARQLLLGRSQVRARVMRIRIIGFPRSFVSRGLISTRRSLHTSEQIS